MKRVLVEHNDELEELKKAFVEHDQKLTDTKAKHHLGMWNMAVKSAKQMQSTSGDIGKYEGGGDTNDGEFSGEPSHKYQEVCRDNISLRLRLLAGMQKVLIHTHLQIISMTCLL